MTNINPQGLSRQPDKYLTEGLGYKTYPLFICFFVLILKGTA